MFHVPKPACAGNCFVSGMDFLRESHACEFVHGVPSFEIMCCEVLLEVSARRKTFCPTLPPWGGGHIQTHANIARGAYPDACEHCPIALTKKRERVRSVTAASL